MRKMLVIAAREYLAAVRSKAFLITLVAMPIMMGGSIVAQLLLRDRVDTADKKIAIVDRSGQLFDSIAEAARLRNETGVFQGEG